MLRKFIVCARFLTWTVPLLLLMAAACSTTNPTASSPARSPAQASAVPSISPTPAPTPIPPPSPTAAPASLAVNFSGLPAGTYPVHLHSRCDGSQAFHITVLETLQVGSGGAGTIDVPSSYFDRGLCVIVYTSSSVAAVLTTRAI